MDVSDLDLLALAIGGDARRAAELLETCGGIEGVARLEPLVLADHLAGGRRRAAGSGGTRVARAARTARAARAARALAASIELGRRVVALEARVPERFTCSADAAAWAAPRLATLPHEELWILGLDSRGGLRGARCVAKGGLHGVGARVPDVLRSAIGIASSAFVLVHNHPGGDATPSAEDLRFTDIVARASRVVDVPLVDHVVVARSGFTSVPLSSG
jgi:DNA repair protein RadC